MPYVPDHCRWRTEEAWPAAPQQFVCEGGRRHCSSAPPFIYIRARKKESFLAFLCRFRRKSYFFMLKNTFLRQNIWKYHILLLHCEWIRIHIVHDRWIYMLYHCGMFPRIIYYPAEIGAASVMTQTWRPRVAAALKLKKIGYDVSVTVQKGRCCEAPFIMFH